MTDFGIPYAHANDDGTVTCPVCGQRIGGVDETQETAEDALTKGASRMYAEHYESAHYEEGVR
jgi:uncharacterized Zn finger protein (UPF0148 family)